MALVISPHPLVPQHVVTVIARLTAGAEDGHIVLEHVHLQPSWSRKYLLTQLACEFFRVPFRLYLLLGDCRCPACPSLEDGW